MKLTIDSDSLSENTAPEELTGLEHVLQAFLQFVHKLQGKLGTQETPLEDQEKDPPTIEPPTVPPADPVGDVIILNHKMQQLKAGLPRKTSGWTSVSLPDRVDDRHI
jgi:hypothetical protein